MPHRGLLVTLYSLLLVFSVAHAAESDTFPHRSLTLVVPAAPTSLPDVLMRLIARPLAMTAGQAVTINDVPEGEGTAAVETVRRAQPDGHTLLAITARTALPNGAFRPVILVARNESVGDWYGLVVPAATPATVVDRLNALIDGVLKRPEIADALRRASLQPAGGSAATLQSLFPPALPPSAAATPATPTKALSPSPQPAADTGGVANPLDVRVVFDSLGDPIVKIFNRVPWTIWGSYTKVDCVNTHFGCEGESTPHLWGPLAPRSATMNAGYSVYPKDPCLPYSIRELVVHWKYVERVNGKAVTRTGVTRAPGFGPYTSPRNDCETKTKATTAAATPSTTGAAPSSPPANRPATPTAAPSASATPSAPANPCGTSGQILFVRAPSDIPAQCYKGRADNWAQSNSDSGVAAQELCSKAVVPYDNGNRIPPQQIRNMSACFCLGSPGSSTSTASPKCWTFFDRVY